MGSSILFSQQDFHCEVLTPLDSITIVHAGAVLNAAECKICPGGMKIYPPSALAQHVEREHAEVRDLAICNQCGEEFQHSSNGYVVMQRCGKCRLRNSKKGRGWRQKKKAVS